MNSSEWDTIPIYAFIRLGHRLIGGLTLWPGTVPGAEATAVNKTGNDGTLQGVGGGCWADKTNKQRRQP